jgi:glucose/mannose-6-phosphate isomerase
MSPLFDLALALPEHLSLGATVGRQLHGLPQRREIENVVILGMGTGRIVGHFAEAVGAGIVSVPILVESSYEIPAYVGRSSLIVALSGSGNTDEVNHAAAKGAALGARLVAIASGGWLSDLAKDCGAPFILIPPEIRPARAAFGIMLGGVLGTLEGTGLLPDAGIEGALSQLLRRREELHASGNGTERLAERLADKRAFFQGDTPLGATAAQRWKTQFNQNARQQASASAQPDASHNEVMAWDFHAEPTPRNDAVVLLRHDLEDVRVSRRIDHFASSVKDKVAVYTVHGEGPNRLAVLMDLALMGDVASLHVASRLDVDPLAVPAISAPTSERFAPPER